MPSQNALPKFAIVQRFEFIAVSEVSHQSPRRKGRRKISNTSRPDRPPARVRTYQVGKSTSERIFPGRPRACLATAGEQCPG